MGVQQYFRRNKVNGGFNIPSLTNNAIDSFGFLRIYSGEEEHAIRVQRTTDNAQQDVSWDGKVLTKSDFTGFITSVRTQNHVDKFYPMKKTDSEIRLNKISTSGYFENQSGDLIYRVDSQGVANGHFQINGTIGENINRNANYFAVTFLIKGYANGSFFFISTHTANTRVKNSIGFTNNGYQVSGRRVTGDSASNIESNSLNYDSWRVVTAIWDYANQQMILRVDGNQEAIATGLWTGGNSDDTVSIARVINGGRNTLNFGAISEMAHVTLWGEGTTPLQIQEVENFYIELKNLL